MTPPRWFREHTLEQPLSLALYDWDGKLLFSDTGKWLHPLLATQNFLETNSFERDRLLLHDRIAGRSAAALTILMGLRVVKVDLMSTLAANLYTDYGVDFYYNNLVERIDCQTESLLDGEMSLEEIANFIEGRVALIAHNLENSHPQ